MHCRYKRKSIFFKLEIINIDINDFNICNLARLNFFRGF